MVNGKEVILDAVLVRNLPRFQWDLTRQSVFNMVLLPQKLCFWMYNIYIYTYNMYVYNCIYIPVYVSHMLHGAGIITYIWVTQGVNVRKYTIHGALGYLYKYTYTHSRWILRYLSKHQILSWFGLILPLIAKKIKHERIQPRFSQYCFVQKEGNSKSTTYIIITYILLKRSVWE